MCTNMYFTTEQYLYSIYDRQNQTKSILILFLLRLSSSCVILYLNIHTHRLYKQHVTYLYLWGKRKVFYNSMVCTMYLMHTHIQTYKHKLETILLLYTYIYTTHFRASQHITTDMRYRVVL